MINNIHTLEVNTVTQMKSIIIKIRRSCNMTGITTNVGRIKAVQYMQISTV